MQNRSTPVLCSRVDCAATFLMKDMNPQRAVHAGINGCAAGGRILAIAPDKRHIGLVYLKAYKHKGYDY